MSIKFWKVTLSRTFIVKGKDKKGAIQNAHNLLAGHIETEGYEFLKTRVTNKKEEAKQ